MARKRNYVARSCGFAIALVGIAACANEPKTPTSTTEPLAAPMPPASPALPAPPPAQPPAAPAKFTLAPPVGTSFVRTEKRSFQSSLVGTPIARRDEQVLRWQVDVGVSGDRYLISQKLTHLTMKHNDATVIDADVTGDAVSAQLLVDRGGHLVDVRGLDKTSKTLRALAGPGAKLDKVQEYALSPAGLKELVTMRYNVLTGDIAGRPATPAASWTVKGSPKAPVISKTLTVERIEPCGNTQCARIRADIDLDAVAVFNIADDLVKRRMREIGGDASKTQVQSSTYSMAGAFLIEPATMLSHGATLAENGRFVVAVGKQNLEVTLTGSTEYTYDYGKPSVAQASNR